MANRGGAEHSGKPPFKKVFKAVRISKRAAKSDLSELEEAVTSRADDLPRCKIFCRLIHRILELFRHSASIVLSSVKKSRYIGSVYKIKLDINNYKSVYNIKQGKKLLRDGAC